PRPRFPLRILIPMAGGSREANDNQVGPAVAVDVGRPAGKRVAVAGRAVPIAADRPDLVHLPVRRLIPNIARQNVQAAITVDVRDRDSLGVDPAIDDSFLPGNTGALLFRSRRDSRHSQCHSRQPAEQETSPAHYCPHFFTWALT